MSDRKRDGVKLSFSELDKLRRERKHGSGRRGERSANSSAQKNYRAALEQAFDSGRLAEFAATLQRGRESSFDDMDSPKKPREPEVDARLVANPEAGTGDPPEGSFAGSPDSSLAGSSGAGQPPAPTPKRRPESPERADKRKLAKQITEAEAPRDIAKAIERYIARFEALPKDLDILEKALSHPKTSVVLHALEQLEAWVAKQKPRRSRSLAIQLTILEETHDDDDVRARAARVRAAL